VRLQKWRCDNGAEQRKTKRPIKLDRSFYRDVVDVPDTAIRVRTTRPRASTGLVDYLYLADDSPVNTVRHPPADGS